VTVRSIVVLALALAGCRGTPPAAPPAPTALGAELIDPGAGSGDVIVATVDGRPVWGSCVTGHVHARGVSVDQALNDCVELELLAAEAVKRGLAARGDTQRELRAALVDGYVGKEFEDKFTTPAQLPAGLVESSVRHNAYELDRPEERTVVYARAKYGADMKAPAPPEGSPTDLEAHAFADEIYAQVATATDLFPEDLFAAARRIAGTRRFHLGDKPFTTPREGYAARAFAEATFAIPAIGQVSPPTRTKWGWDVILLIDIHPPHKRTREELVAEMFPGLRRGYFDQVWTAELEKHHAITEDPDQLAEPGEEPVDDPAADPDHPGAVVGSGAPR